MAQRDGEGAVSTARRPCRPRLPDWTGAPSSPVMRSSRGSADRLRRTPGQGSARAGLHLPLPDACSPPPRHPPRHHPGCSSRSRLLVPIKLLQAGAQRLGEGELSQRIPFLRGRDRDAGTPVQRHGRANPGGPGNAGGQGRRPHPPAHRVARELRAAQDRLVQTEKLAFARPAHGRYATRSRTR